MSDAILEQLPEGMKLAPKFEHSAKGVEDNSCNHWRYLFGLHSLTFLDAHHRIANVSPWPNLSIPAADEWTTEDQAHFYGRSSRKSGLPCCRSNVAGDDFTVYCICIQHHKKCSYEPHFPTPNH
ncbi:hypothetical protein [Pseudomonas syringae]|uniref:hypothetical protein n=1 Tax=Pseudomonas syringae TaxID=317 RepID=UPI0015E8B75B|nr:hypothetical protein [Pseudomonas syringae]